MISSENRFTLFRIMRYAIVARACATGSMSELAENGLVK